MGVPLLTFSFHVFFSCLILSAWARTANPAHPIVTLDAATFVGATDGLTNKFLGIPYAKPPRPVANDAYFGTHDASKFSAVCPQHLLPSDTAFPPALDLQVALNLLGTVYNASTLGSEDCLSVNVWAPSGSRPATGLPIIVWIHGGGHQVGSSAFSDGKIIVERSIQLGEPLIFVSMNYRLSAFGFLPGREAQEAGVGNLGYRDQRLALHWIQRYIHSFGGDPRKVVIWGQSAGAVSVAAQLQTNNGHAEGLFRGAYMQSGSLSTLGSMQGEVPQRYYDDFVSAAGCQGKPDTLHCMRQAPYATVKAAMDAAPSFLSYRSLALSFAARTDGNFLPLSQRELAVRGAIASVPVVIGTCDDEGTLFALPSLNVSTSDDAHTYLSTYFLHNASSSAIDELLNTHYPADPALGSPFNTGSQNEASAQFKRLSAIIGDWVFEAQKRIFLKAAEGRQDLWTYVSKRQKNVAVIGSAHLTDIYYGMFAPSDMTDHLIYFTNHLDPNGPSSAPSSSHNVPPPGRGGRKRAFHTADGVLWPKYNARSGAVLVYLDGTTPAQVVYGLERVDQVQYLQDLSSSAWTP